MKWSDILRLKSSLIQEAKERVGVAPSVELILDRSGSYPEARDYSRTDGEFVYFSPKILDASYHRVDGILRHELGHALLMQKGIFLHREKDADAVAEWAFGVPILYDDEDVQSTLVGKSPRPSYLPK